MSIFENLKALRGSAKSTAEASEFGGALAAFCDCEGSARKTANELAFRKAELREDNPSDLQERLNAIDKALEVLGF